MIVDTSAILAILLVEPDATFFRDIIDADARPRVSVSAYLEASLCLDGRGPRLKADRLDGLLSNLNVTVEPITVEQAKIAREAGRLYGKGRHPAKLNFGDCFSYALAKATGEPLLFKGDDFGLTDIKVAA